MVHRINTDRFNYHSATGTFTAEASDFNNTGFSRLFRRLFSDACDEGFELVSQRTGKVVKMYFDHSEQDGEGDLTLWMFKPYRNDSFNSVIVFND